VNNDRAMPARYRGVVDHNIVVREPADAVQADLQRNLLTTIEKPACIAGRFHRDLARGERSVVWAVGSERKAKFSGESMSAGRVFDTASGRAKGIATSVTFEMYAQQPWIHGERYLSRMTWANST
jgi:hypothetical protein